MSSVEFIEQPLVHEAVPVGGMVDGHAKPKPADHWLRLVAHRSKNSRAPGKGLLEPVRSLAGRSPAKRAAFRQRSKRQEHLGQRLPRRIHRSSAFVKQSLEWGLRRGKRSWHPTGLSVVHLCSQSSLIYSNNTQSSGPQDRLPSCQGEANQSRFCRSQTLRSSLKRGRFKP